MSQEVRSYNTNPNALQKEFQEWKCLFSSAKDEEVKFWSRRISDNNTRSCPQEQRTLKTFHSEFHSMRRRKITFIPRFQMSLNFHRKKHFFSERLLPEQANRTLKCSKKLDESTRKETRHDQNFATLRVPTNRRQMPPTIWFMSFKCFQWYQERI